MNRLNKTGSAVFLNCRFFLFLKDLFFPDYFLRHCDLHVDWRSLLRLASEVCTCRSRNYNNNRNNNSNSSSQLSLHKILPMPEKIYRQVLRDKNKFNNLIYFDV